MKTAAQAAREVLTRINGCGYYERWVRGLKFGELNSAELQLFCAQNEIPVPCPPDCATNLDDEYCNGIVPPHELLLEFLEN